MEGILHAMVKGMIAALEQARRAAAIDEIETTVVREAIDCEFARVPGYLHAPIDCDSKDDNQDLKKVACLAQQFGFDAAFLESIPHFGVPGIRFADQARFHPRKYLARLIEMIPGDRSHVFEKIAAGKFDAKRRRVKASGHWITVDRVAILDRHLRLHHLRLALQARVLVRARLLGRRRRGDGGLQRKERVVATFWYCGG